MEIDDIIARHSHETAEAIKNGTVTVEFAHRQINELIGHARYMELCRNEAVERLKNIQRLLKK